jgi:predicted GH43/DUF377 family glycosyl hydrolase
MNHKLILLVSITFFNVIVALSQVAGMLRLNAIDKGIVLSPDQTGGAVYTVDGGGIREAIINKVNDTYYMFYDGAGPNGGLWRACLAKSTDLVNWTKLGKQLNTAKDDFPSGGKYRDLLSASSPWVYYDNGKWYMYYLGCYLVNNGIPSCPYQTLLATSPDITGPWSKINYEPGKSKSVSFYTIPGSWMSASASPGQVLQNPTWTGPSDVVNKKYLMFFSGSGSPDGTFRRSIGIARTNDLAITDAYDAIHPTFWSVGTNPVFPPTDDVENSSIYYEPANSTYFLFTDHIYNNANTDAVWVYWTKDLESWDPRNKAVVLDKTNCSWSKGTIGMPSVVKISSTKLALVYDGLKGAGTDHLNRQIGLATLDLPLIPPAMYGPHLGLHKNVSARSSEEVAFWKWGKTFLVDGITNGVGTLGYSSTSNTISVSNEWVEIDLGSDIKFNQVILYPRVDMLTPQGTTANFPVDFTIQVKQSNGTYKMLKTVTGQTNPNGQAQVFDSGLQTARYIKLNVTKLGEPAYGESGKYRLQLSEIEINNRDSTQVTSVIKINQNSNAGDKDALRITYSKTDQPVMLVNTPGAYSVHIINSTGKLLAEYTGIQSGTITLSKEKLIQGAYIVQLMFDGKCQVKKTLLF